MSDVVVRAEGLSKRYRIGAPRSGYRTLREVAPQAVWASLRRLGRLIERRSGGSGSPDTIWALKDVSFEVARGEVLGIIGRNGAGKSTLLKILSRITKPTSGSAVITGRVGSLLEVGTGFHPELTGRENIYLNGAILGMKRHEIARKFDEIVAFSEIDRFLDTPVKHYSSGMYVRLAFAVAAHLEPEILVVDEVLAVGDAAFQRKCLGKIGNAASEGRTVLFVSHNMKSMRSLCARALWIDSGSLVSDGSAAEVSEAYLNSMDQRDFALAPQSLDEAIRNLPPDPAFRLRSLTLKQRGSPIGRIVMNGYPLEITIHYDVLQQTTGLRLYIDVSDIDDTVLFRSFHDEVARTIPIIRPGHYVSTAVIPADLLGPTSYQLSLHAGIYNERAVIPEPGIRVPVLVEATGSYNRGYPNDTFRGKLALVLKWTTDEEAHVT